MPGSRCAVVAFAVGWLGFVRPAFAESAMGENDDVGGDVARTAPRVTTLLSPSVLYPFATLSVERRLVPWLGIAGLAGGGWSATKPDTGDFHLVPAYEVGAQVRTHLFVPTKAWLASDLGLGLEVHYGHVRGSEPASRIPFMIPQGLSVAPFLTMSSIGRNGFTFSLDTGFAFLVEPAPLSGDPWPGRRVAFFERLNVGWSFQ
jgi:hypothetical protein